MDDIITPEHHKNIINRGLPKTEQSISYAGGDDGTHEAGWWVGRFRTNNRQRFILRTLAGDDIVFDRATGLMWARDGDAAGCFNGGQQFWANAITYCNGLNFAGFTDWRLPNIFELYSIGRMNAWNPAIQTAFTNTKWDYPYWSSTSRAFGTTAAWANHYSECRPQQNPKVTAFYLRAVRLGV